MKYIYILLIALLSISSVNAQKFWVNGAGNWNDTKHWASQSGGKGGESVPNLTDKVIFDDNSFPTQSKEVTVEGVVYLKNITATSKFKIKGNGVIVSSQKNLKKEY